VLLLLLMPGSSKVLTDAWYIGQGGGAQCAVHGLTWLLNHMIEVYWHVEQPSRAAAAVVWHAPGLLFPSPQLLHP
jgi:hypothetical protein